MAFGTAAEKSESGADTYEPPALIQYGTIEEWTKGSVHNQLISISLIL
jgi:hypothetical protein